MAEVYFSPASFQFLRELARNNRREWFARNKSRYEDVLRQPYLRLIADLQAPLADISTHFRADPRIQGGSLFRIHRDTRYSPDKTPYKTWAGARLGHVRCREVAAPSFYLHIQPGQCFVGGGLWQPQSPTLNRIRAFIVDNPAGWKKAVHGKAFASYLEFRGQSLLRPPRGFDPGHALIDDIKRKSFAAAHDFDDALVCSAEWLPNIIDTCKRVTPLVDYLCAALDLEF